METFLSHANVSNTNTAQTSNPIVSVLTTILTYRPDASPAVQFLDTAKSWLANSVRVRAEVLRGSPAKCQRSLSRFVVFLQGTCKGSCLLNGLCNHVHEVHVDSCRSATSTAVGIRDHYLSMNKMASSQANVIKPRIFPFFWKLYEHAVYWACACAATV